jgi:hypothetical protein
MNVIENIYIIVDDYQKDTNKRPAALILGPREYRYLCDYVSRNNAAMKDAQVFGNLVTEFIGLPVYLKELPGIDLMIPHVDVMKYV